MPVSYSPALDVSDGPSKGPDEKFFVPASGGGGGVWTPADLFTGGYVGDYWDFTDASTLWQDVAGTSQITTSGQNILRADGLRGSMNITQSTTSNSPTWGQNSNSKYGANFGLLGKRWLNGTLASEFSTFAVMARIIFTTNQIGVISQIKKDSNNFFQLYTPANDTTAIAYAEIGGSNYSTTAVAIGSDEANVVAYHDAATPEEGVSAGGTEETASTAAGANFGTELSIGANPTAASGQVLNAFVHRLIVINKLLSAEELSNSATWLSGAA